MITTGNSRRSIQRAGPAVQQHGRAAAGARRRRAAGAAPAAAAHAGVALLRYG